MAKILNYKEFTEELRNGLKKYISDEFEITELNKINTISKSYNGIGIIKDNIGPTINVDSLYSEYLTDPESHSNIEDLSKILASSIQNNVELIPNIDDTLNNIKNIIKDKENLILIPFNNDDINNHSAISYKFVADIPFGVAIDTPEKSILITDMMLDSLNLDFDELYNIAKDNIIKTNISTIKMSPIPNTPIMIAISNKDFRYGANVLVKPELLESYTKDLNINNPVIIPSSKHEIIIVDADDFTNDLNLESLNDLICQVNKTKLIPSDVLSYNAYKLRDGQITLATDKDFEFENNKDEIEMDI